MGVLLLTAPVGLAFLAATGVITNPDTASLIATGIGLAAVKFISNVTSDKKRLERLEEAEEDPSERLRHRIASVNTAFSEAAALLDDLRRDLEAQQAARAAIKAERRRRRGR
ncbi:hypothetical protein AB0B45_20260 [Nonomuraea sp. NPDC049152]|uniref:hypothetical protein n=1 Tax=Nonomuraea sp. NPDC049152 TaxID=3154350 RepID=UPI0033CF6F7D